MDRFFRFLFIFALLFLTYFAGSAAVYFRTPVYTWFKKAEVAYLAVLKKQAIIRKDSKDSLLITKPVPLVHEKGAYEGYTLYTSILKHGASLKNNKGFRQDSALLLDMQGKEVYRWTLPFSKVWRDHPQVKDPVPDEQIHWRDAHVYPNGDLLALYETRNDTPYGYGLAKLDKDSKPLWRYNANAHHAFNVGADGTIYVLTQTIAPPPDLPSVTFANAAIFHDWLVWLTPEGKEIGKISLIEAMANSQYRGLLRATTNKPARKGDVLHSNYLAPLDPEMAKAFPMFKPGQVLVSLRNLDAIGVVDLQTRQFTWLAKGIWKHQHAARFEPDGSILLFDNLGSGKNISRVLKFYPQTHETRVIYQAAPPTAFYSHCCGMAQQLPNGNMLITSSKQGRIFEITPAGKIVWKFITPYMQAEKRVPINIGKRYSRTELPFMEASHAP